MALLGDLPNKGTVSAEYPTLDSVQTSRPHTLTHTSIQPQEVRTDHSTAALIRVIRKRPSGTASTNKAAAKRSAGPSDPAAPQPPSKKAQTSAAAPGQKGLAHANQSAAGTQRKGSQPAAETGAQGASRTQAYTFEELKVMKAAELKDAAKAKGVKKLSGNKDELIRRILDQQRAAKGGT